MSKIDVDATVRELEGGNVPGWIVDHLKRYQTSHGQDGYWFDSTVAGGKGLVECLLLTTVGRRSGAQRTMPLFFGRDGDSFVIIGSKGGAPTQPAWYFNLLAEPTVELQVGADKFPAKARIATGAERARLWDMMVDVYPMYTEYQRKTTREIPVIVLARC